MSDALNAFTFHGLVFHPKNGQQTAQCPFCDKEDHFFVKPETGQFNCRRCQVEGNIVVFLEELWKAAYQTSNHGVLQRLAKERSLEIGEMLRWGLRASRVDESFILPMYNAKGKFANLAKIARTAEGWKVYGTPTCKLHPFGVNLLQKEQTVLWVTEGPWDGIALSSALRKARWDGSRWVSHTGEKIALKTQGVIAAPGAGTFNAEWLSYFQDRDVRLVFDNDHPSEVAGRVTQPGWDGMKRIVKMAQDNPTPAKLSILTWGPKGFDPELPDGYDVRDLSKSLSPVETLTYLTSHLKQQKSIASSPEKNGKADDTIQPIQCDSFDELCMHFDQPEKLCFTEDMKRALAIALATVISTPMPDEQLWFRIIGPPSSGKTTIAECVSAAREYCFPKSILTGLHSGMAANRSAGRKEPSLVPLMNGKCVVIKDADTLLTAGNKDKILAELRDIYDGTSRAHYRTGKRQDFENLRSSFLLCATDAIRRLNRSFLGERFLDCDIIGQSSTAGYLDAAISSTFSSIGQSMEANSEVSGSYLGHLKQVTYGILLNLRRQIDAKTITFPTATPKIQEQLKAIARLLAFSRARVERDQGELCYRPRTEIGARLVKQFAKLAICLSIVFGKSSIDKEVMALCLKVLHDTSHGYPYEVMEYLYGQPTGKQRFAIAMNLGIPETTTGRTLDDLLELGIVSQRDESNNSGKGGRNAYNWFLSREVRDVIKTSKGL